MRRECKAARSSKGLLGLGRATLNLALAGCFAVSSLLPSVMVTVLGNLPRFAYSQEGPSSDPGESEPTPATSPDRVTIGTVIHGSVPDLTLPTFPSEPPPKNYVDLGSHGNGGTPLPPAVTVRAPAPAPVRPEPGPKDPAPANTA